MQRLLFFLILFFSGFVQAESGTDVTPDSFNKLMTESSNWGRWGEDDQLGSLNLITPRKRIASAKLVQLGVPVSLSRVLDKTKSEHNPNPAEHKMILFEGGAADVISINFHGLTTTHIDGLAHFYYQGRLYNGVPANAITDQGAQKLGSENLANGIFTRGILIDLPRHQGKPYLAHDEAIHSSHLESWHKAHDVEILSGDAILIRTGKWSRVEKEGHDSSPPFGGLHVSAVDWFKHKDISVVGTDVGLEIYPSGVEGITGPVHLFFLVAKGTPVLDNLDLEKLSEVSQQTGRIEFLLTTAPVGIPGGTGAPVNPIAVF